MIVTAKLKAGDELIFDTAMKLQTFDSPPCVNNSKDHFSFRHGPMMLGVESVIGNENAELIEINIARDAEVTALGGDRYEPVTTDGKTVILQPMWDKENLIDPLDVFQMLFRK